MITECTAGIAQIGDRRLIVKNRDKSYKPELEIHRELTDDGVELLYYADERSRHAEGMNSKGLAIIYTTTQYDPDFLSYGSNNQKIIKKALKSNTTMEALKTLASYDEGGVVGITLVSAPEGIFKIENRGADQDAKIQRLPKDKWHVVSNHNTMLDGGLTPEHGEDYVSSIVRRAQGEAALHGVEDLTDALTALRYQYFSPHSHLNVRRDADWEITNCQIGLDCDNLEFHILPYEDKVESLRLFDDLPDDYEPKINLLVRQPTEPEKPPFLMFVREALMKLDEHRVRKIIREELRKNLKEFNLVDYLNPDEDGSESDSKNLPRTSQREVDDSSDYDLARKAQQALINKATSYVDLRKKVKNDPVFYTAGASDEQAEEERKILDSLLDKLYDQYADLEELLYQIKYNKKMPRSET